MDIKLLYSLYREHQQLTTDSRDCPRDSMFLALRGESFDGNRFAAQALQKGCAYAIVDSLPSDAADGVGQGRPVADMRHGASAVTDIDALHRVRGGYILVDDCLQTLKLLAREHRRQFDIPVIAITGTNGKTTTKELVRAVLAERYEVLATEGNFNNDVGVPKTLLRLRPEHQVAVIEMGASHPGDIRTLAETAEPTCGLITNVGRAHLAGFGSFEGVVRTKCELYDYLCTRSDGLVFVNADDDVLVDNVSDELWMTPYSADPDKQYACISGQVVQSVPLLKMSWRKPLADLEEEGASQKWHKVQTQLVGDYNIYNVLAAVSVGINFGVDRRQICHAIENYRPTNSRSQLMQTAHNTLVVDAYNANPSSMEAAIANFSQMEGANRLLILGDMRELGESSAEEHQRIADLAASLGAGELWLVGPEFGRTVGDGRRFADVDEVKKHVATTPPTGRLILIKGSHGTGLYQLPGLL